MKQHQINTIAWLINIAALIAICFFPCTATAQSMAQSDRALKEFVMLNNSGGNKSEMYRALQTCYQGYINIVKSNYQGDDYNQARESLKIIYPYLQSAAGYYSQINNQRMATFFACAYVDMPMLDAFRDERFSHDSYYPTIVYFAASNSFNSGDYEAAIKYYEEYLKTGEQGKRKNAYGYLYKACVKAEKMDTASSILEKAVADYPNDFDMLSLAINAAIDIKDYNRLSGYVNKALQLHPNNPDVLNIQGKMYEETGDFESALKVYEKMKQMNPRSLSITEHLALNTYNLGVMYYNKSSLEEEPSRSKKLRATSNDYFTKASKILSEILLSNPTSIKYTQALAIAYSCTNNSKQLDATNFKLQALGSEKVSQNAVPSLVGFNDKTAMGGNGGDVAQSRPQSSQMQQETTADYPGADNDIPLYSVYAKQYIEEQLKQWQSKDPYETVSEYKKRVNNETKKAKVEELQKSAEREYINRYAHTPRYDEMRLMPYDSEHQAFLIVSAYGNMVVPVSRERNEAKIFQNSWRGMQFKDAQYYIDGDSLALASLTFVTPSGTSYKYDNKKALEYIETQVEVDLAQVDYSDISTPGHKGGNKAKIGKKKIAIGTSDVDKNIPQARNVNANTFAVIIANEKYEHVPDVGMAMNDGNIFAKYCHQTLGVPDANVRMYQNATYGSMINAVRDIQNISKAYNGDIKVIFYYAGHGIPDERTKDAYLLPVDADGRQMAVCYSLKNLYGELSALGAKHVVVFLDACFSGSTADGGNLMAAARGVALKPKKEAPQGNMVVFSAASDAETAFPYEEQGHGMFTYYLLKKLQETKGGATLKEIGDYIIRNVREKSVVVNRKPQTPTVLPSASVSSTWQTMTLK